MTFKVGQKVVCVNAKGGFINLCGEVIDSHELTEGAVYTIRTISISDYGTVAVRLKEITRRKLPYCYKPQPGNNWDQPFRASRFRPLVQRKTDISIFTEIVRQEGLMKKLPMIDWTSETTVKNFADTLGPDRVVYKHPNRFNYNIALSSRTDLYCNAWVIYRTKRRDYEDSDAH